jgi:hypothetical protein
VSLSYYRCEWTHPPSDDPIAILYEADADGRVPRLIDIYANGRRDCVSVVDFAGQEAELPGVGSLVEGAFHEAVRNMLDGHEVLQGEDRMMLVAVDASVFETEWRAHRL